MTIKFTDSPIEQYLLNSLMRAPFETGSLIVNFNQNQITLNGEQLDLQPKVLELLVILCAANGQTLSKQMLIDALWPNTVVGPDSLANTMTRLRKALNDDAKSPRFIKTVQRKGYLWLPSVVLASKKRKKVATKPALITMAILFIAIITYVLTKPEPKKFPFPDLSIQKLDDGGYEIEVGIEGELTKEKEAAMLKELKRITGEEGSDMTFTVDDSAPKCTVFAKNSDEKVHCQKNEK